MSLHIWRHPPLSGGEGKAGKDKGHALWGMGKAV